MVDLVNQPQSFRPSLRVISIRIGCVSLLLIALWLVNFNVPALLLIMFLLLWMVQSVCETYGLVASFVRFLLNPTAAFRKPQERGDHLDSPKPHQSTFLRRPRSLHKLLNQLRRCRGVLQRLHTAGRSALAQATHRTGIAKQLCQGSMSLNNCVA